MAIDNILYINTASIAVGTITDASGVGLVPSASHALHSNTSTTASYALAYAEMPKYKSGVVAGAAFGGTPKTASVAFTTVFDDANYSVALAGGNARSLTVENIVAGGFTISSNSAQALDEPVYYLAVAHGESN